VCNLLVFSYVFLKNLELCTIKEHGLKHRKPNRKRVYYPSGAIKIIKE
jgi:hypothetical protein